MTEKCFLFKKLSSKNIYRDVKWSVLNPAKKAAGRPKFFPIKFRKRIGNVIKVFLKNIFRRKSSYGHVQNTFDNPIGKKIEKNPKVLLA